MKKIFLLIALFTCSVMGYEAVAQTVTGGAGVIFVDADPNTIPALNDVGTHEGNVAYNRTTKIVYFFDAAQPAGSQWIAVSVADLENPVQSITGDGDDITVTDDGNGNYTVSFDSDTQIEYDGATNTITYTDEDGDETDLVLTGVVDFDNSNSINVTGSGTDADPYVFELDGAHTPANAGGVPVTDGDGNLTWTDVIESMAVQADGTLLVTMTDGTTTTLDLDAAPKVTNIADLNAAQAALVSGTSGIAVADESNTFGLPATSDIGVIFFIKKD